MGQSWTENKIIQSKKDRETWGTMIAEIDRHDT